MRALQMRLVSKLHRGDAKRWRFVALAILSLWAPTRSSAGWEDPDKSLSLPIQKFDPLPGKVVGVLASNSQALFANEGRKGPADAVTFGTGTGSQHWIYVPDQKKPMIAAMRLPIGQEGKQQQRFNRLNFATQENLKAAGITQPFTLAEVEVNGGLGCPAAQAFVATAIKPVEGTKLYPLKVSEVMDRLQSRFDQWKSGRPSSLETTLAAKRNELGWLKGKDSRRSEEQIVYVTWVPARQVLQAQILSRLQERDPLAVLARPAIAYEGDDGAPPKTKAERVIGAEEGLGFEVSRFGKVERIEAIPIKEFHQSKAQTENIRAVTKR
jgi:hypothetical protein